MSIIRKANLIALVAVCMNAAAASADTLALPDGSVLDLGAACPVCSMKTGGGKIGPAAITFKDGRVVGFDGPGDLFRYLLEPAKYGVNSDGVKNVFVTDYTTKKIVDAKTALYVLGSEVSSEMGPEAVPFASKEYAEKFKASHKGKTVVPFEGVKLGMLASLKKMLKMRHDGHGSKSGH
jgi:nitrous oxide reductase accessory protein NosL